MAVSGAKAVTFAVFLGVAAASVTIGFARKTSGTANILTVQSSMGTQRRWIDERDIALHTDIPRTGLMDHRRAAVEQALLSRLGDRLSRLANGTFAIFKPEGITQLSRRYYGKPSRLSWGDTWQPVNHDKTPALDWAVALAVSAAAGSLTPWPLLGALLGALLGSGLWADWQNRPKIRNSRYLLTARHRYSG